MSLKGIISVGGMSGLYKVISPTKSGYIVESLSDQKKTIIQSTQKISTLDDISIYTSSGEKPLKEVLLLMKEKENNPIDIKSEPAELKKYFKTLVPDFDEDRVYVSHIKKIISWYQLVKEVLSEKDATPAEKISEEIKADTPLAEGEVKSPEENTGT